MSRKRIAIVMGGYSAEWEVSLQSAEVVYQHLDHTRFEAYLVRLERHYWRVIEGEEEYPIDKDDFSFEKGGQKFEFDAIFNAIHGTPGEDGPLAGYFELLNIPQTASGQFESALTFNKAECNLLLKNYGIPVPEAVFLHGYEEIDPATIVAKVGLPCFVKPSRSGSSIGVTKVKKEEELKVAIAKAKEVDQKVLVEQMIDGLELGCGVSDHTGAVAAIAVTDIVPKNEFFDYESKYSGLSEEVTPARIEAPVYEEILRRSEFVYRQLGLRGLVRIDYILRGQKEPVLIEVNTVPGLSKESILPKQARYSGIGLDQLFNQCLENILT